MKRRAMIILWVLRFIISVILLQTLYFKFTGQPESVALFTKLGVEPWGRIALGCVELLVGITLLIPKTSGVASFFSTGLFMGAIATHFFIIGIVSDNDGGMLFLLATIGFLLSASLFLAQKRRQKQ